MSKQNRILSRAMTLAAVLLVGALSLGSSCSISFGSGTGGSGCGNYCTDLGVPFRAQDTSYYCGPATILMWRLYDNLPEISQATIAAAIGCTTSGVSMEGIADGVVQFTSSGFDAVAVYTPEDNSGSIDDIQGRFYSSEVSSISFDVPLIANWGFNHAVIVVGGRWSKPGSYYVWETVRMNDPLDSFGGKEVQGAEWVADTWGQGRVIDWGHHLNGTPLNNNYGNDVHLGGGPPGGGGWPPNV